VRKEDPARADTILYNTAEAIRQLAILAQWIIPVGAGKILDLLGQSQDARNFSSLGAMLEPGLVLPSPTGVFPRLELAA
jgi:methionyl-tRNA synthetase